MPLKTIRLELARTREHPEGSADHGYEFTAPLTADGHIDLEGWRAVREKCTVRRFWRGDGEMSGRLVHRGSRWAFHYDGEAEEDEEPIFRFDRHTFNTGDYLTITEYDGEQRTFRVVSVR